MPSELFGTAIFPQHVISEYHTKRVILEMYDAMEAGTAYVTRLELEAGSVLVAHAPRDGGNEIKR